MKTGLIYGVKQNGTQTLSYTYDQLARIQSSKIHTSTPFVTEYTYLEGKGVNSTTTLVKSMKLGSDTYGYSYDNLGNITQITKNGTVVESYEYDSLSQLTKVTNSTGVYVYTYDGGGNITSDPSVGSLVYI